MAVGDAAAAAGMALVPGSLPANQIETEINRTRDEIANRAAKNASDITTTSGSSVQTSLDSKVSNDGAGALRIGYIGGGRIRFEISGYAFSTTLAHLSDLGGYVQKGGDTMSGDLFLPASSAASSGWTNAYINSDGRVCRGASSLRYKKYVKAWDPQDLGDVFPTFHRFQMKAMNDEPAEGKWRFGYIAERMAENPDQEPFVNYREVDGVMVPDSVNQEGLAIVQINQLHRRLIAADELVASLIARIEALEAKP